MAFTHSGAAQGAAPFGSMVQTSTSAQVVDGPELPEIQTDQLGFSAVNGDSKIRLLPNSWPSDSLPPPTSSLLAVASKKGLLAAAGPDTLVLCQTSTVRNAFHEQQDGNNTIKSIQPEISIPVPRLSHVAFSSDENVLVVSSEQGGGLAAYQVSQLTSGQTKTALELQTNNTSLRALVPNPAVEMTQVFAMVTSNGDLLLADLKTGALLQGQNGPVLKSGVSCVSWSNKGKALVAGLGDGTATQLKADGTVMAEIPKSPSIPADMHMSAISWLENDVFFAIYTSSNAPVDDPIPPSEYWVISRTPKTSNYTFQRLQEVCGAWGMRRTPSFHYISRLRSFPPNIEDLLLVASTTSADIGLVSKASKPLSADEVAPGTYALTMIGDDTRRAALPLSQSGSNDTSPIGVGIDLSSIEEVVNPIPSDPEIRQSSTPLPNFLALNNEGILVSWWVVYGDSIRKKTLYSGLVAAAGTQQAPMQSPIPSREVTPAQSMPASTGGFGQPSFASSSSFVKPTGQALGTPASPAGFGGGTAPSFGQSSPLVGVKPSWATTGFPNTSTPQTGGSGFGQPAFGSATPIGRGNATPAFGGPSALGSRPSPFGSAAPTGFGQTSGFGTTGGLASVSSTSPFAAAGATATGFASFANMNGTSAFSAAKGDGESPFAKASSGNTLGEPARLSPLGSRQDGASPFGQMKQLSGFGSGEPFKIESSFKGDGSAKDDLPKPSGSGGFGFGGNFGDILGESKQVTSPTHDKEAEMGDSDEKSISNMSVKDGASESAEEEVARPNVGVPVVTPPSTLVQSKATPAPPLSNLFGNGPKTSTTPQAPPAGSTGFSFGTVPSTTPKETPASKSLFNQGKLLFNLDQTPKAGVEDIPPAETPNESPEQLNKTHGIKVEPPSDDETTELGKIPEAPLPPDPTSKASYSAGGPSASSTRVISNDDAPLPPDFLPRRARAHDRQDSGPSEGPGDDGEFSSDFEGSGEDVTQDISPIDGPSAETTSQIQMSPESSFGRGGEKSSDGSPTGGLFTKITTGDQSQKSSRALFGEVGSGPILPPPIKPQESPDRQAPVRKLLPTNLLRTDAPRSVSAPPKPASIIEQRRAHLGQSGLSGQSFPPRDSSATRAQAQAKVLADAKAKAEAEAAQLEDDEDERLREELAQPLSPSQNLAPFVPFQQSHSAEALKQGIPGQIERLYQDINSMVDTLGINARSLSSFMLYQQDQEPNDAWPQVLGSETPLDTLNDEWVAGDIPRLHEGISVLAGELDGRKPSDVAIKLQQCQELLSRDLPHLRTISAAVRRTLDAQASTESNIDAPLSAEQASIQHDLRKAATNVQLKLTRAEEMLSVLRAKLAESGPKKESGLTRSVSQHKPTVEAVTNTIAKMTSMAEQKSTEIDVLEAKLKKLELLSNRQNSTKPEDTPEKMMSNLRLSNGHRTPGSSSGSVYHTPDSKFGRSITSTTSLRSSMNGKGVVISTEDRQAWKEKAVKRKEITSILKKVLMERNGVMAQG